MKRWSSLLSLLCLLVLLLAAGPAAVNAAVPAAPPPQQALDSSQDWARVQDAGKIVIGTSADYEPFEFYNSNFALDGFDIALMQELGKRMGVEVEFKDFAFDGLLNALQLGQVDAAIGAISVTPERQALVDFSNLYYVGDDAALVTAAFTGTIASAADLAGLRVAVERGTTYEAWVQQNVVDAGLSNQEALVSYGDTSQMIRDLRNGTVDVALLGSLPARQFARRFADLRLTGESLSQQEFGIAARKASSLIPQFNKALLAVQSDGTFADLVERYLQVEPEEVTPQGPDAAVDNQNPPPTPPPAATPAAVEPAATPTPAPPPAPTCIDGMAFISDLNYDDQNMAAPPVLTPGQAFVKSWRVQNTGTCTWTPDYVTAYVNGNRPEARMGGAATPIGYGVAPGGLLDISVSLVAPTTYGVFQGFWQMRNGAGEYFGQVMWVGIQVPDPNPPAPPPAPPSPPAPPAPPAPPSNQPNLRADASYLTYGQCTTVRWDVDGVQAVYFIDGGNQIGVGGHDARTVCPDAPTTYYLRVVQTNGASTDYPITINVTGGGGGYYIDFWADQREINRGSCTTLHWETQGVQAVYLDDQGVVGVGDRQVCPSDSKTYKLKVVRLDNGIETREIRIRVY